MIYGEHKLFIRFNVIIETQRLSVFTLNPIRTERLGLMKSLSDKGLNSKQISDYLNFKGYKTPKGHRYYPKLVWVTLKKYQRRLDRLQSSTKIISVSEKLYLRPLKNIWGIEDLYDCYPTDFWSVGNCININKLEVNRTDIEKLRNRVIDESQPS